LFAAIEQWNNHQRYAGVLPARAKLPRHCVFDAGVVRGLAIFFRG
jgi:hypothetical protein